MTLHQIYSIELQEEIFCFLRIVFQIACGKLVKTFLPPFFSGKRHLSRKRPKNNVVYSMYIKAENCAFFEKHHAILEPIWEKKIRLRFHIWALFAMFSFSDWKNDFIMIYYDGKKEKCPSLTCTTIYICIQFFLPLYSHVTTLIMQIRSWPPFFLVCLNNKFVNLFIERFNFDAILIYIAFYIIYLL